MKCKEWIALNGIRFEASLGQGIAYGILFAQQTLSILRTNLISVEPDEIVASYSIVTSIDQLSAPRLGLNVIDYDPTIHFDQVGHKWSGLRTPDGRWIRPFLHWILWSLRSHLPPIGKAPANSWWTRDAWSPMIRPHQTFTSPS